MERIIIFCCFALITSCGNSQSPKFTVEYLPDSIVVDYTLWNEPLKIKSYHKFFGAFNNTDPVYAIDSIQSVLYLHNPYSEIVGISLDNKEVKYSLEINSSVSSHEHDFIIQCVGNKILFSSNSRLWILDKTLKLEQSIIDSVRKENKLVHIKRFNYEIVGNYIDLIVESNQLKNADSSDSILVRIPIGN